MTDAERTLLLMVAAVIQRHGRELQIPSHMIDPLGEMAERVKGEAGWPWIEADQIERVGDVLRRNRMTPLHISGK